MNFDKAFSRKPSWDILAKASGRWPHLLVSIGGLQDHQLSGTHQPCPCCGGTDRYRWMNDEGPGGWYSWPSHSPAIVLHYGGHDKQPGAMEMNQFIKDKIQISLEMPGKMVEYLDNRAKKLTTVSARVSRASYVRSLVETDMKANRSV